MTGSDSTNGPNQIALIGLGDEVAGQDTLQGRPNFIITTG
jgi:hypothetical protein